MSSKHKNKAGFSLIELSIWITLIALFMSTMLSWLTPAAVEEADKITVTNQRLNKIEQAIENFRVQYGRLPCPARATYADTEGEAYREYCVTVRNAVTATTENIGVVPVKSLGLQGEDGVDGWGRRFTYHVSKMLCDVDDDDATNPPDCSTTEPCGETRNCTPTRYRCGPSSGGDYTSCGGTYTACVQDVTKSCESGDLTVYRHDATAGNTVTAKAAYVIVSHGPDGQCAYMTTGSQRNTGSGCTDGGTANIGQDENYYSYAATTNDKVWFTDAYGTSVDSATFDDIVRYKTKSQMEARTLDTYTYALPLNPVTTPAKLGCSDADALPASPANINSVYEAIRLYDTTVQGHINSDITYFDDAAAGYTGHASERFLGVLWTLQEVCASYYSSYTRACPAGKTYSSTYYGCL